MEDLAELEKTLNEPQSTNNLKHIILKDCRWCGHPFIIKTPNQHYCCENCKKEGFKEKNRLRQRKFYKIYGKDRYKKGHLNPGGPGLGQHAETNHELEYQKIQRELKRLKLNINS